MNEREPYSEWYWTWVDHPVLRPWRVAFDWLAHSRWIPFPLIAGYGMLLWSIC